MSEYAKQTTVPADRTRMEIERLLTKFGADGFGYVTDLNRAMLTFRIRNRMVRLTIPLPKLSDYARTPKDHYGYSRARGRVAQQTAMDQALRTRWRSVKMIIYAKLEAVQDGVSTIEREFMADLVIPGGRTLSEALTPQFERIMASGWTPQLMPHHPEEVDVVDS
jgi:hypothetical protein